MARRPIPTKKLAEKWRRPSVADDVKICTICNSELIEPRTLPCMHSFCEECIFVLLRCYEAQKKLDRTFLCPTCRVRTPCHILGKMHHDWLTMFPKKSAIDKMKEAITVVEEMCHPCSKTWTVTQAIKFCVDCQEYLCETCGGDHVTNAGTKTHNTVEYEVKKMKNTPIANISKFQCKIHSSLRYYIHCIFDEYNSN
ncbi:E3 ubiquitin-protein ligase trim56 [Mactra antiquata]